MTHRHALPSWSIISGHMAPTNAKTHVCVGCEFPIAVYGRLQPCLHAFCLCCSSRLSTCLICQQPVSRIERLEKDQGLFISPVTLQSFVAPEEIDDHAEAIQSRLLSR